MRLEQLRAHVAQWEAADLAISKGKSYTLDGISYTRQDAEQVRAMLDYWTRRLAAAMRGRGGSIRREAGIIDDIGGGKLC